MNHTYEIRYEDDGALLFYRPVIDDSVLSEDPSATIAIYDADGNALLAATAMTWDSTNARLTYTLDASDTDDYPNSVGYRAVVSYTVGSVDYVKAFYFSIVNQPWEPNVITDDITAMDTGLDMYQDDMDVPDYGTLIQEGEVVIRMELLSRIDPIPAGRIINKDHLDIALKYWVLKSAWERISGKSQNTTSGEKASYFAATYNERYTAIMGNVIVDHDDDNLADEASQSLSAIRLIP